MLNLLFALLFAVSSAVSLSISPSEAPAGEKFKFLVSVTGPFKGSVCVAVYQPPEVEQMVGHICPSEGAELEVKEEETAKIEFVSSTSIPGTYGFKAVTIGEDGPTFYPAVVTVVVSEPKQ